MSSGDQDKNAPEEQKPTNVTFVLLDNFSLISYASAIEPLRLANKALGHSHYCFANVSVDGGSVRSSNGSQVKCDASLSDMAFADLIVICSSDDVESIPLPKRLATTLRDLDRRGCQIAGICTGSYVLAKLGLLDGRACTIHWEYASIFSETFPEITLTQNLVEISARRLTCAGGTAPLDLMLHYLGTRHGAAVSGMIADLAIHHSKRENDRHQRLSIRDRLGVHDGTLLKSIQVMEENIEAPLSMEELAARAEASSRQIQRAFKTHNLPTPSRYYQNIRLDRARNLLRRTSMSVTEIVYACGFVSPSHFTRCYRGQFGICPHKDRNVFLRTASANFG